MMAPKETMSRLTAMVMQMMMATDNPEKDKVTVFTAVGAERERERERERRERERERERQRERERASNCRSNSTFWRCDSVSNLTRNTRPKWAEVTFTTSKVLHVKG